MTDSLPPRPADYWLHRRRLAYVAMTALVTTLGAALAGFVSPAAMPLIEGLSWVFAAIVLGYYGNNAIEAFAKGRK